MSSRMIADERGNKFWVNEQGERHRKDGPACEWSNGDKSWWFNGLRHRICGPAIIYATGEKEWWVDEEYITDLVEELLTNSPFGDDVHLGILAEYLAERGDFRLLDIVQPLLEQSCQS